MRSNTCILDLREEYNGESNDHSEIDQPHSVNEKGFPLMKKLDLTNISREDDIVHWTSKSKISGRHCSTCDGLMQEHHAESVQATRRSEHLANVSMTLYLLLEAQ